MGCLCICVCGLFFFFKQKTAYEMRISGWSSDVCSSDLPASLTAFHNGDVRNEAGQGRRVRQAAVVRHIAGIERSRNLGLLRTFLSRRRAEEPGKIGRASCRERACKYV